MKPKSSPKVAKKAAKPTIRELADALHVSIRRVSQLRTAGMPVSSIEDALAWREARDQHRDATTDSAERLRLERIELVREQRAKIELENAVRREELVDRDSVFRSAVQTHSVLRLRLMQACRNDLPPRLQGLDAPAICRVLREWAEDLLAGIVADYRAGKILPPAASDPTDINQ